MPTLCLDYWIQFRTIFSLFALKKRMLGFAQIISVFRTGWRFARVCVGTRYPEHVAVRRSVNDGLVRVCFSVTPGWQFLCERIKIKGYTAFLSKLKHKFVNNSCSNWYGSDCIIWFYFILPLGVNLARMWYLVVGTLNFDVAMWRCNKMWRHQLRRRN